MADDNYIELDTTVEVRDLAAREIEMRIVPWNVEIETLQGPEEFVRGAFDDVQADKVLLMGLEHEVHFGIGQSGQVVPTRHPVGKGIALENREDGEYLTAKVSKTARGDEVLALAADGIASGVSVEIKRQVGGTETQLIRGRRKSLHRKVALPGVSLTYQPAYADARVVSVRTQEEPSLSEKETPDPAPEPEPTPEPEPSVQVRSVDTSKFESNMTSLFDRLTDKVNKLEEEARSAFTIPQAEDADPQDDRKIGKWMKVALTMLTGERVHDAEYRTVADMVTSENIGVVPPAYLSELIGVIDRSRPFMASTRRLNTPAAGMSMVVPKITERPTTAVQSSEKTELSSNDTTITTETFNAVTIGGYGDISLQLLKRSDPSFLELYIQLLSEAYAADCETEALRALFDEIGGGITGASSLDPNDLQLGSAYQTSFDAIRRPPDTIWLSTEAVGEFIDAQASTTNMPLYSTIRADATAGGGITGTVSGLRVVHVPALDAHGAFAVVGPSNGFAWAEDGTYTLQVDVPSKAGRDVALVGMLWFAPWYPEAFTAYNVAS